MHVPLRRSQLATPRHQYKAIRSIYNLSPREARYVCSELGVSAAALTEAKMKAYAKILVASAHHSVRDLNVAKSQASRPRVCDVWRNQRESSPKTVVR